MSVDRAREDLESLEKASAQLRTRLAEIEARAAKVRAYIELAEEYCGIHAEADSRAESQTPRTRGRPGSPSGPRSSAGIVARAQDVALQILRLENRPIPTRELLPLLTQRGVVIGGNLPASNLAGMMSRFDAVKSSKEGWMLADSPDQSVDATEEQDSKLENGSSSLDRDAEGL